MTREDAVRLAVEAGMTCYGCKSEKLGHSWHSYTYSIERFATLVAEKERAAMLSELRLLADSKGNVKLWEIE